MVCKVSIKQILKIFIVDVIYYFTIVAKIICFLKIAYFREHLFLEHSVINKNIYFSFDQLLSSLIDTATNRSILVFDARLVVSAADNQAIVAIF